jgi:peptidylprolyl isomerase
MTKIRSLAALAAVSLLALAGSGCGSTKPGYADKALNAKVPAGVTQADAATTAAAPKSTGKPAKIPSPISTDLKKKPAIPKPSGDQPTSLISKDIVTGKGAAAKKGDNVTVKYVGVGWPDGKQFDASWDNGADFPFVLGQGNVIPGWDTGIVGMKVGGRRLLAIPSDQAYGAAGSPPKIAANEALVFVVDLVKIGK